MTYELGYSEMVAANPGVDAWLPVKKHPDGTRRLCCRPVSSCRRGKREGIVINLAEYRLYYFPKGQDKVYTFPLGIGREGWGSPIGPHQHHRQDTQPDLDASCVDQGRTRPQR
jgi:L,D-transpeptidase ErfK/SrfK